MAAVRFLTGVGESRDGSSLVGMGKLLKSPKATNRCVPDGISLAEDFSKPNLVIFLAPYEMKNHYNLISQQG
ncbi:hypothetical protein [Acutalibacter sp. 1XD8-33]|uniref:hypothetical protein n=1 Tax=Acutalibacter sp. 1XD8-33 TaxID=2320081 RepID=UPI001A9B3EC7|nr:hypothetical protein [Acutalibacter sp. 1XD8-33]